MPYNHTKLEERLKVCDLKLHALFTDNEINELIRQKIKAIETYYNLSYTKATTAKTIDAIAKSYELFIEQLEKVKKGELSSELALKQIENSIQSRKMNTVFYNLAKACELIFWKATTFSLYTGILGIALPLLIVQPLLGVAVAITIGGAMLAAAYKGLKCFSEFKSLNRHSAEYTNEASLVSFFNPVCKENYSDHEDELVYELLLVK
ncbi:MAG: hypothetical protein HYX60_08230 [Legionella longbeachae]|nr:hypothetical protein [Legionella longbeachae]